ncbi:MAG: hypothetical protein ACR2PG_20800 [Hyphomicrobiaceae bacterium]
MSLSHMLRIDLETATVCATDEFCLDAISVPRPVYGIVLMLFIDFLPKGFVGAIYDWWQGRDEAEPINDAKKQTN